MHLRRGRIVALDRRRRGMGARRLVANGVARLPEGIGSWLSPRAHDAREFQPRVSQGAWAVEEADGGAGGTVLPAAGG